MQVECGLLEKIISADQDLVGTGRWLRGSVNSSLVVDTEKQIFYFNTKAVRGNAIDWLVKIKGFPYSMAKEYVEELGAFSSPLPRPAIKNEKVIVPFDKLIDTFHSNLLSTETNYWSKRGINKSTIERFRLGRFYDELKDIYWNTVPVIINGNFYNFQLRTDEPEKMIRYYYRGQGPLPFNFDILSITDSIIICEGPTDCLRLTQEGVPCVSHTAGAGGWKTEWFSYFMRQKKIYVLYDNDESGVNGAKKLADKLGTSRTKIYTFSDFNTKGYDIINYYNDGGTTKELLDLLENKSKYSFSI